MTVRNANRATVEKDIAEIIHIKLTGTKHQREGQNDALYSLPKKLQLIDSLITVLFIVKIVRAH